MDLKKLTYAELAKLIWDIWAEVKRRNPIGVNCYANAVCGAAAAIQEIADAELVHPTSESGPGIDS